ncbi:AMP-binding protein [Oceanivirga salmonicida]|uniref:AMP-binding protein n=1 Tax=Oceanivirga salmonicida TaxID=1769291 RepID=UPI0012E21F2F|nr:AMP-binding protein [Oceanivirga salmonicida]
MFLKKSDKLAIVDFDGRNINYNEMVDSIKYLSRKIFENINEKEKVLIVSENRIGWIYSFFAIWDRNSVAIPVDALCTSEELEYFFKDSSAKYVVVSNQTVEAVKEAIKNANLEIKVYNLDEIKIEKLEDDKELIHPVNDELAVMVYTSGTTGSPKGVMLSFNNLYHEMKAINSLVTLEETEQILAILPFHHILPLMSTCIYFFYYEQSYSVVLVPKLTSQEILRCLKENRVTILSSVPRLYKLFYKGINDKINAKFITRALFALAKKINNKKFSKILFKKVHETFGGHLRTIVAGGAKSDVEMIDFYNTLGFDYCEGYGLSETSPVFAGSVPRHYKAGTVGLPASNAQIKLVDKEIWVKGPMVMLGYYNKPEKTKEVLTEDGWFKTGDLGEFDEDGYLTLIGRANAMIVLSNGKNIDPLKLEDKLIEKSDNLISEVGIFGKNDKLSALIVPNFEYIRQQKIGNITTYIRDVVQVYNTDVHNYEKILDYKIIENELPKTRVGKVKRFMLPEIFGGKVEKKKVEKEPNTEEYITLKEYIKNLKGLDEVSPVENFELELGLDSLDLVEFTTYLEKSYNLKLDEEIFTKCYNLELLSDYIHQNSSGYTKIDIKLDEIIKNAKVTNVKTGYLQYILRPIAYVIAKLYFRLSINGKNKIEDKPTIFIANHESFIDAPVFTLLLPFAIQKKTYYLGLEKYFSKGIMKHIGLHGNIVKINIEKNIKESVEKVAGILKQGKNVFIFPEGSRTKDGSIQEFKKIFAILAKELDIEIQCLGIDGAYEAYSRFMKLPKPKKISVSVLDRISPTNKTYEQIVNECREVYIKYKENKK